MDIKLFGRILIKSFNYYLMRLDLSSCSSCAPQRTNYTRIREAGLTPEKLNFGNGCGYALKYLKYVSQYNKGIIDLVFYDGQDAIGYAYIFLKGTKDKIVSVSTAEAYISQIEVFSGFRGKGYSKEMLYQIIAILKERNIQDVYLACRPDNEVALCLYDKMGFKSIRKLHYVRTFGINFPKQII